MRIIKQTLALALMATVGATGAFAQANDLCVNATPISGFGMFAFTNVGAATDGLTDTQCTKFAVSEVRSDVWYAWTPTSSGSVDMTTCLGTTLDTRIAAYPPGSACPPAIDTAIACNDDTCGLQSTITFNATSGMTYLLRVGSFSTTTQGSGTFEIMSTPGQGFPSFCSGDGTLVTPCPCGNFGAAGEGCGNSTGTGALLSGTGSGSLANMDATLTLTQLPVNQFGILYSGLNNPEFAFGDGVRCVGQSLKRSAIQNSGPGGTISLSDALGAGALSNGAADNGMTRFCQGWYRDPGGPCANAFNVSNAIGIMVTL